jgi:hypothetical protein
MLLGVLGSILPILPGAPIIFAAMLAYGYYEHFQVINAPFLLTMLLLTIFTFLLDYLAGILGAKKFGATRAGVAGGVIGGIIGFLLFPPWGLIIGLSWVRLQVNLFPVKLLRVQSRLVMVP